MLAEEQAAHMHDGKGEYHAEDHACAPARLAKQRHRARQMRPGANQQAMEGTPENKVPARTMPQTGDQEHDHEIAPCHPRAIS